MKANVMKRSKLTWQKGLLLSTILLACTCAIAVAWQIQTLKTRDVKITNVMKARLKSKPDLELKKKWVDITDISPHLIQAVLYTEDPEFFMHQGLNWEGLKFAAKKNWKLKQLLIGGSSISQQLVKNLYLTQSRSLTRKAIEIILTLVLEKILPKQKILELYLNHVEWGPGIFGVQAASQHYFNKSASCLNMEEAARLSLVLSAPLSNNPLALDPYGEYFCKFIQNQLKKNGSSGFEEIKQKFSKSKT